MRICVYTVLLGGYDTLLEQDVASLSGADFLCFSDDPDLRSDTWEVVPVEPYLPQDLHRSSRVYKILGHERLGEYDVTVCIDASVRLRVTPEELVADWLTDDVDMALALHSFREQVLDEFDEVIRLNYDDRARVYEQLTDYGIQYPDVLESRPHWGGMIVRRNTDAVRAAMRLWFDHVLRYSRRDQLSLMVALLHTAVRYRSVEIDNFDSPYQEWPVITGRKIALGKAPALPAGPMIAEVRRARRRIAELEAELSGFDHEQLHSLHVRVAELEAQVERGTAERAQLEAKVLATQREVWHRELELENSVSIRGSLGALKGAISRRIRGRR